MNTRGSMFGTSPSSSKKMTENRPFLLGARRATQARHTVVFLVLAHDRRRILHFNVTAHPTADWTGQQLREAFPFAQLPRYLLRDRDAIFGDDFREHLRDMGICEVLSAPRSPWQRAHIERVIGSVRRECLDHMIVFHETSLRRTLTSYFDYYPRSINHLSLGKDAPEPRAIHPPEMGSVVALPLDPWAAPNFREAQFAAPRLTEG